jgi:hypothetical protein
VIRHLTALAVPAAVLAWWALASRPTTLGAAGIGAILLSVPALIVLAVIARRRRPRTGPERAATVVLFVAAAALTALVWFRVWHEDVWGMGGIVVGMADIVGFWWPAVLLATVMWVLEEMLSPPGGWPRLRSRVGVGFLAGAAGAALYHFGSPIYYARVERTPIAGAVGMVAHELGTIAPPAGLPYRLDAGHLVIESDAGPAVDDRPYIVLSQLERGMARARELLDRTDVDRLTLVLRARGGELVRLQAGEADRAQALWSLARLDRARLKDGGRLDAGSLDAMLRDWTPDDRDRFLRWFAATSAGDEVRISFQPDLPPGPDTAPLYGAGWASANSIVREVTRYFPEVARFAVTLPGRAVVVARDDVGADFRLQHGLVPPDRVLGLALHDGSHGDGTLEPAKFFPQPPVAGFQIAVAHFEGPLEEHAAGVLFERVGRLGYVVEITGDATATIVLDDHRARAGPIRVRPGETVTVESRRVHNLGWLPRAAFVRARG